jgi:hypothetical protein
MEDTFG